MGSWSVCCVTSLPFEALRNQWATDAVNEGDSDDDISAAPLTLAES